MPHLLELGALERVFLWGTQVSEEAAKTLRAGRATLYVNTGFEKIQPPSLPVGAVAKEVRFIRIDLPGDGKILSLAEVEVISGDDNVAAPAAPRSCCKEPIKKLLMLAMLNATVD